MTEDITPASFSELPSTSHMAPCPQCKEMCVTLYELNGKRLCSTCVIERVPHIQD